MFILCLYLCYVKLGVNADTDAIECFATVIYADNTKLHQSLFLLNLVEELKNFGVLETNNAQKAAEKKLMLEISKVILVMSQPECSDEVRVIFKVHCDIVKLCSNLPIILAIQSINTSHNLWQNGRGGFNASGAKRAFRRHLGRLNYLENLVCKNIKSPNPIQFFLVSTSK